MTDSARTLTITLPLPPKELSPNYTVGSRGARLGKAAKVKKYRKGASMEALVALGESDYMTQPLWTHARIQIDYYHRTAAFRDPDNIVATLKSAIDGLTDAGVLHDDRDVTYLPVRRFKDARNPRVELHVAPIDQPLTDAA